MTVQKYLSDYARAARAAEDRWEQIIRLRSVSTKATTRYSLAGRSSGVHDLTGEIVARIVDMTRDAEEEAERMELIRRNVEEIIGAVGDQVLRDLLRQRYIYGSSWKKIAAYIGRTEDDARVNLHRRAIKEAEKSFSTICSGFA